MLEVLRFQFCLDDVKQGVSIDYKSSYTNVPDGEANQIAPKKLYASNTAQETQSKKY